MCLLLCHAMLNDTPFLEGRSSLSFIFSTCNTNGIYYPEPSDINVPDRYVKNRNQIINCLTNFTCPQSDFKYRYALFIHCFIRISNRRESIFFTFSFPIHIYIPIGFYMLFSRKHTKIAAHNFI